MKYILMISVFAVITTPAARADDTQERLQLGSYAAIAGCAAGAGIEIAATKGRVLKNDPGALIYDCGSGALISTGVFAAGTYAADKLSAAPSEAELNQAPAPEDSE